MNRILILNFPGNPDKHRLFLIRYFLERNGFVISILTNDLWQDETFRIELAKKPWLLLGFSLNYLKYLRRMIASVNRGNFEFILIGYPALIDLTIIRLCFPSLKDRLYIDYFLSFYDTIVADRQLYQPTSPMAKLILTVEKVFLRLSPHIIVDTNANARRYQQMFRLKTSRWHRILVGSRLLTEVMEQPSNQSALVGRLKIGWVGAFIPLHGIEIILQTAEKLKDEPVEFYLIGDGQEFPRAAEFIAKRKLERVSLVGRLPFKTAMEMLSTCDICLGIFGKSAKAGAVIPIKIFDYLCLGKWIITQKSVAFDELPPLDRLIQIDNNPDELCRAIHQIIETHDMAIHQTSRQILQNLISNDVRSTFKTID